MAKAKIGILHPKLGWGGSEVVALRVLLALKDDHEVTFITSGRVDIPALSKYYGLNLDPKEFSVVQVSLPFFLQKTTKFAALRGRFVQRYCQQLASDFDLMISTYNLCNFKVKSIQFAVDIEELPAILPLSNWGKLWYGNTLLRKIYLKFCNWISPTGPEKWKDDVIVAISKWTAELIRKKYGAKTQVIYPPVVSKFPGIPFEKREKGFIWIGRIVPTKRIDVIIKILEKVRQRNHDIHFHVIGGIDTPYARSLKRLSLKYKDWLFFEGRLSEEKKKKTIARHRFGISARKNEPFGIAVAEMVKAGCIVFVPQGGGQVEIVNHHKLIYGDVRDAVRKIEAVLENSKLQEVLRHHLSVTAQKFSRERFNHEIRNIVHEFLVAKSQLAVKETAHEF